MCDDTTSLGHRIQGNKADTDLEASSLEGAMNTIREEKHSIKLAPNDLSLDPQTSTSFNPHQRCVFLQ